MKYKCTKCGEENEIAPGSELGKLSVEKRANKTEHARMMANRRWEEYRKLKALKLGISG